MAQDIVQARVHFLWQYNLCLQQINNNITTLLDMVDDDTLSLDGRTKI